MNRYQNIPKTKIDKKLVYVTSRYPEVPVTSDDVYVYTVQGDRLDNLSYQFYQDSTLYWVIVAANPNISLNSFFLPIGSQLRIPANPEDIINSFNIIINSKIKLKNFNKHYKKMRFSKFI